MGVANRDLDASEQVYLLNAKIGAVATGVSTPVALVPSLGQVLGFRVTGKGVSGSPTYQLAIARWTSAGITNIALGSAQTVGAAYGVSGGSVGASFAADSSLAAVQADDMLVVNSGGSNAAVTDLLVSVVISATQDIKKSHGLPV